MFISAQLYNYTCITVWGGGGVTYANNINILGIFQYYSLNFEKFCHHYHQHRQNKNQLCHNYPSRHLKYLEIYRLRPVVDRVFSRGRVSRRLGWANHYLKATH